MTSVEKELGVKQLGLRLTTEKVRPSVSEGNTIWHNFDITGEYSFRRVIEEKLTVLHASERSIAEAIADKSSSPIAQPLATPVTRVTGPGVLNPRNVGVPTPTSIMPRQQIITSQSKNRPRTSTNKVVVVEDSSDSHESSDDDPDSDEESEKHQYRPVPSSSRGVKREPDDDANYSTSKRVRGSLH